MKRLYIPLPEEAARRQIIVNLLREQSFQLDDSDLSDIAARTQGIFVIRPK